MRRTILLGLTLGMAACGGSGKGGTATTGGSGTTGGCPTALCGGVCCAAGDSCIGNACCPASLSCAEDAGGSPMVCCAAGDSCIGNACCSASQSCGSTCCPGADTDGGGAECVNNSCCPIARACRDICCDPGSECSTDQMGNASCFVLCEKSADCNPSTPCCEQVDTGEGTFSGHGICTATPSPPSAYSCLCSKTSECGILGNDVCAPTANGAGDITGPYVCIPNDGASYQGCLGKGVSCSANDQYCATDLQDNQFCSAPCNADFLCGNPGVACCNTACIETEYTGDMCCGLCQDGGS